MLSDGTASYVRDVAGHRSSSATRSCHRWQDISPFHHLALAPAEDFRWAPFLALAVIAAATSLLGQALFRRRDVEVR